MVAEKGGLCHGIDYVAVSKQLHDGACDCFTQKDYDKLHAKEDHSPVIADFTGKLQGRANFAGAMQYERAAMRDKENANTIANLLDSRQLPNWDININDHFAQTVDAIKKAATTCFKKPDIAPTQPHVSTTTMRLIRTRRRVQHARLPRATAPRKPLPGQYHPLDLPRRRMVQEGTCLERCLQGLRELDTRL